jgi:hypothetical protein
MVGWKKPLNQPAKLAERVLAPGDGEAEPGVTASNFREPAKRATDGSRGSPTCLHDSSVAPFVGWDVCGVRFPRLGFAIAWG